jgi:hypothetical protein
MNDSESAVHPSIGVVLLIALTFIVAIFFYTIIQTNLTNQTHETHVCAPIEYTNGIYYFPCNDGLFGIELAQWKGEHQNLTITTISAEYTGNTGNTGHTSGYFVITEPKGG